MASDREKNDLTDEEIIDLTDVVEEGKVPEQDKDQQDDSSGERDFDEDLNDLFESLSSEKDSQDGQDEFEDLFQDKEGEPAGEKDSGPDDSAREQDQAEDDFLKDFLGDEDPQDQPESAGITDESAELEDLVADLEGEKGDPGPDLEEQPQVPEPDPDLEEQPQVPEPDPDLRVEGQAEPEKEPDTSEDKEVSPSSKEDLPPAADPEPEKPVSGIETLADQLETLADRLEVLEEKFSQEQERLETRAVQAVEEKGLDLGFIEELSARISGQVKAGLGELIEEKLGNIELLKGMEDEFRAGVIEIMEQKGLETSFARDLSQKISEDTEKRIQDQVAGQLETLTMSDESEFIRKIEALEKRLDSLNVPDPSELQQGIMKDVEILLEEKLSGQDSGPDSPDPGQELSDLVDQKISELVESWQAEKKALAAELENALKFWGKMQEKLTVLSQDIGELRDKSTELDPELLERIDSMSELAVTRTDLRNLASQLKVELEEYIEKKVPAAAARVIREEIAAILRDQSE
ncbi:hypothetical protein [Desulfonatronovibrio hydrogenovorans]|uniref:hypothetical protein n=1 Tax=Desulfonatronovibrio hydrogenovorans TaxID=53245 RepID=UPI00048B4C64|nr:hypothetical protein [Desulfonatronovibrio hydrogenovorans]